MIMQPGSWRRIAIALSVINGLAAIFVGFSEPMHAGAHVALAVAFGLWAQRLGEDLPESQQRHQSELSAGLDQLEFEASKLRQELSDMHQRLDFAERMLAQRPDQHRVNPPERKP